MSRRTSPTKAEQPQQTDAASAAQDRDVNTGAGVDGQQEPDSPEAEPESTRAVGDSVVNATLPARVIAALRINERFAGLLAEACYVFGIDPNPALKPRELMAFRVDEGEPDGVPPVPPSVVLVTAGGLKLRYPLDDDSENRLRVVYNAYKVDKDGNRVVLPLPQDLTLPRESIDGVVRSKDHQYRTGYLREGGATEAAARQKKLDALRAQGRIR